MRLRILIPSSPGSANESDCPQTCYQQPPGPGQATAFQQAELDPSSWPCATEQSWGSRQGSPPACALPATSQTVLSALQKPPSPPQQGRGGSSLARRQRSPPAPGPGLARHAQEEPKRGRAKLFPAHFSALPHLRALGALQLGSQHPASALQAVPHRAPDPLNTWQGAAQDGCVGQAEGLGLKSQAGVPCWPQRMEP